MVEKAYEDEWIAFRNEVRRDIEDATKALLKAQKKLSKVLYELRHGIGNTIGVEMEIVSAREQIALAIELLKRWL